MKNKLLIIFNIIFLFFAVFPVGLVNAESLVCGDGFCNLDKGENWQNCPQDCIKEENFKEDASIKNTQIITDKIRVESRDTRILPEGFINFLGDENNALMFIVSFLIIIITFLFLWLSKTKIAGKTLKEYIFPIKYYVISSVLIVISQYVVVFPLSSQYPFLINLTQGLWVLMVALSVINLVREKDFNMKNILFLGILYSLIIHGTKVSIRYFFYAMPTWYYIDRFLYGSFLVMVIVIIVGPVLLYLKKKNLIKN